MAGRRFVHNRPISEVVTEAANVTEAIEIVAMIAAIAAGFVADRREVFLVAVFPAAALLAVVFRVAVADSTPAVLSSGSIAMATGCWTPTKWKDRPV